MSESISLERIFNRYKNNFNTTVKDAFSNIKNSKQFGDHQEYLSLETSFDELVYLTSYETFGRLDETLKTVEMDNKANFMKFRHLIQKMTQAMDKIRTNIDKAIGILETKNIRTNDLKTQIDGYRVSSALNNLLSVRDEIRSFTNFFDASRALLSFPYMADVNYDPRLLDLDTLQQILESKERDKIRSNMDLIRKEQDAHKEEEDKKERIERIVVKKEKDDSQVNWSGVVIFCGFRSSQDTLGSREQYLDAIKKYIKRSFDEVRTKSFILPQFHYVLKDFVFNRIKSEMEQKQILYLIDEEGEKVFPFGLLREQIDEFFRQTTKPYIPTTNDYSEQATRIEDSIHFEIAGIENANIRQLSLLSDEQKKALILSQFNRDAIDLYRFLLPPQRKIEQIIAAYLGKK
jgi:hypothetical protein